MKDFIFLKSWWPTPSLNVLCNTYLSAWQVNKCSARQNSLSVRFYLPHYWFINQYVQVNAIHLEAIKACSCNFLPGFLENLWFCLWMPLKIAKPANRNKVAAHIIFATVTTWHTCGFSFSRKLPNHSLTSSHQSSKSSSNVAVAPIFGLLREKKNKWCLQMFRMTGTILLGIN